MDSGHDSSSEAIKSDDKAIATSMMNLAIACQYVARQSNSEKPGNAGNRPEPLLSNLAELGLLVLACKSVDLAFVHLIFSMAVQSLGRNTVRVFPGCIAKFNVCSSELLGCAEFNQGFPDSSDEDVSLEDETPIVAPKRKRKKPNAMRRTSPAAGVAQPPPPPLPVGQPGYQWIPGHFLPNPATSSFSCCSSFLQTVLRPLLLVSPDGVVPVVLGA